jgi:hypothetical protein
LSEAKPVNSMPSGLHHRRCANHAQREAAARCPECKRFFCRECVTEHESRVLCASCLAKKNETPQVKRKLPFRGLFRFAQLVFGILVVWILFYALGDLLVQIPTSFHEGEVWEKLAQ